MTLAVQPMSGLRAVTWSKVDTGFHVASRAGEFVGSIDTTADERYVAFDATSSAIGIYPSLKLAKAAVTGWVPNARAQRERRLSARLQPLCAAAGLVAGTAALLATMVMIFP